MTYTNISAVFVETSHFTHWIHQYLTDEEYRELQYYLMRHPDSGKLIQGSGGIRKLRWSYQERGKSSGIRIIYYWAKVRKQIFMLTAYSKSKRENIDLKTLALIAKQLENIK